MQQHLSVTGIDLGLRIGKIKHAWGRTRKFSLGWNLSAYTSCCSFFFKTNGVLRESNKRHRER